jgi:hypothetical protein
MAARANDGVLLLATACAATGLLLLTAPRPVRAARTPGVWRRGARVRKAAAVENLLREADGLPIPSHRQAEHPAA